MDEQNHNHHDNHGRHVDLPAPTPWPIVTAFGLALLFTGLVTTLAVSFVGLISAIFGAVGWFCDVYPHPKHEPVPVRPEDERAGPAVTSARSIRHLAVGKNLHRVRYPVTMHPYSAGVIGGLVGGAAMVVLALAYGWLAQGSIWYPINLLAAAGVPSLATASQETLRAFSLLGLSVGAVVHLSMSIMVGLLYTILLPMLPAKFEWFWGGIVTPLVWTALMYPAMGIINPALAEGVDWPWFIVCQVAFGMVGGFVIYKTQRVETMQTWPLAEKLGIEMGGLKTDDQDSTSEGKDRNGSGIL